MQPRHDVGEITDTDNRSYRAQQMPCQARDRAVWALLSTPGLGRQYVSSVSCGGSPWKRRLGGASSRAHKEKNQAIAARRRLYSTAGPPQDIAVLGGGLTGLTTAYYLAKYLPAAHITLFEGSSRLGGWIDTEKANAAESLSGQTLFERGARTITPPSGPNYNDLVLYDLVGATPVPPPAGQRPADALELRSTTWTWPASPSGSPPDQTA